MKHYSAFLVGSLFGIGIAVSEMTNPAKVLNFFDVAGTFDPSMLIVMASAMVTAMIGYRMVFGRSSRPVFETTFAVPANRTIDSRLVGGSALFGIGWGIAGYCPGGAIPALALGNPATIVFVATMLAGIAMARYANTRIIDAASARA